MLESDRLPGGLKRRLCVMLSVVTLPSLVLLAGAASTQPATAPSTAPSTQATLDLREAYSQSPEHWPAAHWDDLIPPEERHELGEVPDVVHPADNPYSREKAELGRQLFWDARLSGSLGVACVSCHHPDTGWTDGRASSMGHHLSLSDRNAPTIMGSGHAKSLMWDGRAASLEEQAVLPLANEKEMHADFADVEKRVNEIPGYVESFRQIFGVERATLDEITMALATFQRTVNPGRSRFDWFLRGRHDALSDQELRGLHLFRTSARCINCHSGPLMKDHKFHNLGLSFFGRKLEDLGRYNETKRPEDVGAFKTPTLRNITRTGPYMHNGLFELDGVINLYNAGGVELKPRDEAVASDPLFPKLSPLLKKLNLTDGEKKDLLAFLGALEEPRLRVRTPKLPGIDDGAPEEEEDVEVTPTP